MCSHVGHRHAGTLHLTTNVLTENEIPVCCTGKPLCRSGSFGHFSAPVAYYPLSVVGCNTICTQFIAALPLAAQPTLFRCLHPQFPPISCHPAAGKGYLSNLSVGNHALFSLQGGGKQLYTPVAATVGCSHYMAYFVIQNLTERRPSGR